MENLVGAEVFFFFFAYCTNTEGLTTCDQYKWLLFMYELPYQTLAAISWEHAFNNVLQIKKKLSGSKYESYIKKCIHLFPEDCIIWLNMNLTQSQADSKCWSQQIKNMSYLYNIVNRTTLRAFLCLCLFSMGNVHHWRIY